MVLRTILFILLMTKTLQTSHASGFDAYSSCYRTSRKRQELPCDFGSQTWCTIPGNSYPWHAVRRFVHENQGLMRRMYGDERHISVLRAELESNDVDVFSSPRVKEEFRRRYSKEFDGTKDFVKILMNEKGRKFKDPIRDSSLRMDKFPKSIDESSSNVVYQNDVVNVKEKEINASPVQTIFDKKISKNTITSATPIRTTTTGATSITTATTTIAGLTDYASTNESNYTTTESGNSSWYGQTDAAVQTTARPESIQNNLTAGLWNDTQYDDTYDYVSENDKFLTTTTQEGLTTTEVDFEDDEVQVDKSDNYQEIGEETESIKMETVEETVSMSTSAQPPQQQQQSPPTIRLKGINACPVKEEVVAPFWANNTRGEVLALLNLYPFEQYVHWEKCTYEHKQMFCREGCRCEQQYRLHRLLAYDPNNECRGIFSDWFRFPSCCVCKCYDLPMEFRLTSRSPRFQSFGIDGEESRNYWKREP